ncbi:cupin domain-containing protein [Spartinivicinus poritis]|uniref:Cupin domain-containing protein n=1 Tax=Spartinivicinus poritis TaxID=2994640 RepID=A0ABT5UBT7_9GAMM|nr:cupin domain-containing protein [Spartinivicinus sp. A2-2]MDE1463837.1 cupin domain-containing protein [Spartinivicinus sp. A2-2]
MISNFLTKIRLVHYILGISLIVSTVILNANGKESKNKLLTAAEIIAHLNLQPLPEEGGYYRETYKSADTIQYHFTNDASTVIRAVSTAIYYMVLPDNFSALHRIKQDEVYHHYLGESVEMLLIYPDGNHQLITLGKNIANGEQLQVVVPSGTWQGVKLSKRDSTGYALLGTTVAPGFEFDDFELANAEQLVEQYPRLKSLIHKYTKGHL